MNKIGALSALLAVGLLVGCAGSGEQTAEPSATVTVTATPAPTPTPTPTFSDGLALQQLANIDLNCDQSFNVDPAIFPYYAECNDNVLIEFGPNVDLVEHPKIATDAYGKVSPDPWLISDKWMIKSKEENLLPVLKEHPEAKFFVPEGGETLSSDKLSNFVSVVESISGSQCTEDEEPGGEILRSATCRDGNDEIYTSIYVFQDNSDRNELVDAVIAPFVYNNRSAYFVVGVGTVMTPILDKSDAESIAEKIEYSEFLNVLDPDLQD